MSSATQLVSATEGFNHLFSNEIVEARTTFASDDSPFHLLGLGVCAFLEAALGMESGLMVEAARCLALSEVGAKKQRSTSSPSSSSSRFTPGLEWDILHADAVVLLGMTHALSESYMGYLQCIYSLNSAHSKFTKLYKTVFPLGLDPYATPAATPSPSRKPSIASMSSASSSATPSSTLTPIVSGTSVTPTPSIASTSKPSFFGRWGAGKTLAPPTATAIIAIQPDGPVEEMIVAGTAFGFGLFNLVFSLLPGKIKNVVGLFGFQHNRKLALQALAVSAAKKDVHSVFAGLVLMTYHGVILLLSGYQADEEHILRQYKAIVDSVEVRFPTGALWILNRAKILRMSHDADGAIRVLQEGLKPERPHTFAQADTLLVFELAWTLLSQRRYQESADMFIRITTLNSWSHATYYFAAAGCYISLGNYEKAQELLDEVPALLEKKKVGGKDLPTEVLIKKKLAFYKEKQKRRGGPEAEYAKAIKISCAEELGIFWNTHSRVEKQIAEEHIKEWASLTPPVTIPSPSIIPSTDTTTVEPLDLDTPDELALRSLLLGIVHRTAGSYVASRAFLVDAHKRQSTVQVSSWIGGVAMFELAVLDLKETEAGTRERTAAGQYGAGSSGETEKDAWAASLKNATAKLDQAFALATSSTDLSSRLDSRIAMLKEEIATKKEMMGIV